MLERLPFLFSIKFISDYFDCNTYIRQAKDPHLAARAVGIKSRCCGHSPLQGMYYSYDDLVLGLSSIRPSLFMYGIWHMVHAICFIE